MNPLLPFKAADFAVDFSPKLSPSIMPSIGKVNPIPANGDDNNLVYWGLGFLFAIFILATAYSIYQNIKILNGLEAMRIGREGIMPAIS